MLVITICMLSLSFDGNSHVLEVYSIEKPRSRQYDHHFGAISIGNESLV